MLLLIDIGNTLTKIAVYNETPLAKEDDFKIASNKKYTIDEIKIQIQPFLSKYEISKCVISSVVPDLNQKFTKLIKSLYNIECIEVKHNSSSFIKVDTENENEVGADLISTAIGATINYDSEILIVDLGTATKYVYVKDNLLKGVIITPGVELSLKSLSLNAALLPDVAVRIPKKVLGRNTVECLESGVTFGTAAAVDGLIKRVKKEVGNKELKVIATGGLVDILSLCEEKITVDKDLLFKGLLQVHLENK